MKLEYTFTNFVKEKKKVDLSEESFKQGETSVEKYHICQIKSYTKMRDMYPYIFDMKADFNKLRMEVLNASIDLSKKILSSPRLIQLHREIQNDFK